MAVLMDFCTPLPHPKPHPHSHSDLEGSFLQDGEFDTEICYSPLAHCLSHTRQEHSLPAWMKHSNSSTNKEISERWGEILEQQGHIHYLLPQDISLSTTCSYSISSLFQFRKHLLWQDLWEVTRKQKKANLVLSQKQVYSIEMLQNSEI